MDYKEAIQVIKNNYPPENYTMLREALDLAITTFEAKIKEQEFKENQQSKSLIYKQGKDYATNDFVSALFRKYKVEDIFVLKNMLADEVAAIAPEIAKAKGTDYFLVTSKFEIIEEECDRLTKLKYSNIK